MRCSTMAHRSAACLAAIAVLGVGAGACGPATTPSADSSSGSSGPVVGSSTGDGPGASESGVGVTTSVECAGVYEGDLQVTEDTDLSMLSQIGRVTGNVAVGHSNFVDLGFLGCLREVGGTFNIVSNDELESLAGLEKLEAAEQIWITGNDKLLGLDAVGPVKSLEQLSVYHNLLLSDLAFNDLESVERLLLGDCGADPSEIPPDYAPALTEINGFASLTSISLVKVAGQTELVSLGRLHDIAAAGGIHDAVNVYNNHKLPYSEVANLESLSEARFASCGNLGDPDPLCSESDEFGQCAAPPP